MNWKRIIKYVAGALFLLTLCAGITWLFQPAESSVETQALEEDEVTVKTVHLVVETFQVLPSGILNPMTGIAVLVNDGNGFIQVGETTMVTIDGISAPVWEGDVAVGSWVTIDPPDNCVIWKVGAASWSGTYLISDEYAGTDLPLKFQLVCGEDIPTTTPEPTTPPSGPTETPSTPPTSTPPTEPTETPPTQPTPTPTKAGCNCPPPTEPLPSLPPPTEWDPTPTSTPIHFH